MPKKLTLKEFIERSQNIHIDKFGIPKYLYNLIKEYKGGHIKVKIKCLIKGHKSFRQTPHSHLQGRGCKECRNDLLSNKFRKSLQQFIKEAQEIHKDEFGNPKYLYNLIKEYE